VPTRKSAARVRVFVPADTKLDKPVPLVIALHGAGGSENMFFDTYGAGAVVKLCAERGWLLVAPRLALIGAPPLDAIVDALAERYPVDRSRLLVVGHSLGAAAGLNAVSSAPTKYRAFASLGSGQGAKDASTLAQLPIFVGIGESDFGRRGAESLHASLVAAGSTKATLTIYPKCEHLMVVADALPDVFRFFDEALTK
jgi:predicted peptidase